MCTHGWNWWMLELTITWPTGKSTVLLHEASTIVHWITKAISCPFWTHSVKICAVTRRFTCTICINFLVQRQSLRELRCFMQSDYNSITLLDFNSSTHNGNQRYINQQITLQVLQHIVIVLIIAVKKHRYSFGPPLSLRSSPFSYAPFRSKAR